MLHELPASEKQDCPTTTEGDEFADWLELLSKPLDPSKTEEAQNLAELDRFLFGLFAHNQMQRVGADDRQDDGNV